VTPQDIDELASEIVGQPIRFIQWQVNARYLSVLGHDQRLIAAQEGRAPSPELTNSGDLQRSLL
jgi:hypothetical protein